MPVQTEVFDALCIVLIKSDGVRFEHQIQHDQQTDEHVKTVCAGSDVKDRTLNSADGESFCNQMAPFNKLEDDEQ